jgi:hypothetical protein
MFDRNTEEYLNLHVDSDGNVTEGQPLPGLRYAAGPLLTPLLVADHYPIATTNDKPKWCTDRASMLMTGSRSPPLPPAFCTYYQHQRAATTRWCFTLDVRPPSHILPAWQHPLYVLQAPPSHDSSPFLIDYVFI